MIQELSSLSFAELRTANVRRCNASFHDINKWSPAEWSNAMAGECGEACNLTKKLLRRDHNISRIEIGKEIADVIIYADLLSARLGLDLGMLVRAKFNEVSHRVNSNEKL